MFYLTPVYESGTEPRYLCAKGKVVKSDVETCPRGGDFTEHGGHYSSEGIAWKNINQLFESERAFIKRENRVTEGPT